MSKAEGRQKCRGRKKGRIKLTKTGGRLKKGKETFVKKKATM